MLARDGRKVCLIERDMSEPDRIVGELLQPGGFIALKKLGLEGSLEDTDCHTVFGYVIHDCNSNTSVALSYPVKNGSGKIETGRSFHHGRFVSGLRKQAIKEPNVCIIEGTAQYLIEDNSNTIVGVQYKEKDSEKIKTIKADLTFIADGCFSKFRKDLVSSSVTVASNFVGIILHNVPQYKKGHAEIVLSNGGPILIYQISSTCTRVLVDVPSKVPSDLKEYMISTIAPQLPDHIRGPFLKSVKEQRLRMMPNSFLPPKAIHKPGVLILGDAFNMRHPLTGAGMSVALNDIVLLRQVLQDIPSLNEHCALERVYERFLWKRKNSHSFVINILAQALYAIFSSHEGHMNEMRQACFQYFKLGGMALSGPVGLLSVLHPSPVVLVGHFFAVTAYAIYRQAKKGLASLRPDKAVFNSFMIFYGACKIIFPLLASELEFLWRKR